MTNEGSSKQDGNFSVVGVGVAAENDGALKEFFLHLSEQSGMAFIVFQQADEVASSSFQRLTHLSVTELRDPTRLLPNHVYFVPAHRTVTVNEGELRLAEAKHNGLDSFFRNLAEGFENRFVAVLLSNRDGEGSLGLRHVKEHWGITLAQAAEGTQYSNLVDLVVPVAEMGSRLLSLGQSASKLESLRQEIAKLETDLAADARAVAAQETTLPPKEVASDALKDILLLLKEQTGHDFQHYKHATLLRRIARRLQVHGLSDMTGYLGLLHKTSEEVKGLLHDLLISVTNFFRDEEAFAVLERDILPRLFAGKTSTDTLRVWCCGCATGEEAYSLAMLLSEYTSRLTDSPKFQIFASDISEEVIRTAREGYYSTKSVTGVSSERLQRFFTKDGNGYRVKKDLRDTVLFTLHNVLRDPPFSRLELLSCRNLLIYLNRETQEKVLKLFQFALRPGGYLFLGSSESTESSPGLFNTLDKQHRLYQSRATATSYGALSVMPMSGRWEVKPPDLPLPPREQRSSYGELHYKLLETLAPPSLLVNDDDAVIHVSERAGQFLQVSGGEPTRHLFQLVQPGLKLEVQRALFEAKKGSGLGVSQGVPFKLGGEDVLVTISVRLVNLLESGHRFYLVSFAHETLVTPQAAPPASDSSLVEWLEEELQTSREQLRMTIEQYETSAEELRASNEELQALNEELRAASEELETSKEELQSVNEELLTMVDDLRRTELALRDSEAKYRSLFDSIDEGFCVVEMIFDSAGEAKDYLFLETNKVFEEQTGLKNPKGRTVLELVPGLEQWWLDTYGKVATTGEAVRFENQSVPMGKWFDVYASRVGEATSRRVAIVFRDISKRKRRELNLAFLASLEKEVSLLSSEQEMTEVTASRIAGHFKLAHCVFAEVDEAAALVTVFQDHHAPGIPDLKGVYQLGSFHTDAERQRLARGEAVVIRDVRDAPRVREAVASFEALGVRSLLTAPYVSNGRWRFALSAQHERPYSWREDEEELLTELANWFYPRLERVKAEETLRRQTELLNNVNNTTTELIFMKDLQGRLTYANAATLGVIGLTPEEAVGNEVRFFDRSEVAAIDVNDRRVAETGESVVVEETYTRADGERRIFLSTKSPLRDETGKIVGVIGVSSDITERKAIETKLRESEARFRNMADHAPVMVWVTERDGSCTYLSQSWYDFTGQTAETGLGFGWLDAAHPDDKGESQRIFLEANEKRASFALEYRLRAKDGSYKWHIDSAKPRFSDTGEFLGYIGSVLNIHERKRMEEALRESEARFHLMADTLPQQVWLTDAKGNVVFLNRQWYEYSGTKPEEVTATHVATASLHPEDAPKLMAAFGDAMREGRGFEIEQRNRSASGNYRWFLNRAEPYRDPQTGDIIYWFGSGTDIHDLKLAQETLKEADRRKDEFLAVLAHELRNPLAPIRMGVEIMKRSTDPATLQEAKGIIERQSEQLTRLLDDLLDVSRISRGAIFLQTETTELSEIVGLALESSQPLLDERGHDLTLSLPPRPVYLEADKTRVTQMILNLLTNAAKYTNPGGKIKLSAEREGPDVLITVQDNGIGIPKDMQTKVFDMFTRVERSETYQQQGLGIGLNLVKQLAELHGGTVNVFSAGEGQGSTFTLCLPVKTKGEESEETLPGSRRPTLPRRVLVVDDYTANLKTMARMLKLMGHEVVTAEQGEAALQVLETFNPDVILLDLNMPGMNGYDVAERVRSDLKHTGKKLFALTGYGQPTDLEKTRQAGFDDHLIKPVTLEQLEALLAKI